MFTVLEAKDNGLIPYAWHNVIPNECECGTELNISDNLKTTLCPNVKCLHKVSNRASEMLQNLGVKGLGESYCLGFFKQNGIGQLSHLAILTATPEEHNKYHTLTVRTNYYNLIQEVLKKPRTFREVVSCLSFPGLDTTAYKLFKGNNSFEEAIDEVAKKDFNGDNHSRIRAWVATKLLRGGKVANANIVNTLIDFAPELVAINLIFTIKPDAREEVVIAITGSPHLSGMTKDKYIAMLNSLSPENIVVIRKDSESGVQFILADSESNSSKYLYGKNNNLLINSIEFEQYIVNRIREIEGGNTNE